MGSRISKRTGGTKPSKRTKDQKKGKKKNNPRRSGSTQSVNIDNDSINFYPDPSSRGPYSQPGGPHNLPRYHSSEDVLERGRPVSQPPPMPRQSYPHNQEHRTKTQPQFHAFEDTPRQANPAIPPRSRPPPVSNNKETLASRKDSTDDGRYLKEGKKKKTAYHQTETEKGESSVYLSPNLKFKPEVKAKVSYKAENEGDLSFIKGDIMQIINDEERDGWFLVKDFATGNVGRVPSNCVKKITNVDVESQKFFWDLNKKEAEAKLMEPDIEFGTYLIRRCADTCSHALSLSCETEFYELEINHYKLVVDEKGVCYIDADTNIKPFSSIIELIRYYTEEPGLRCKLKRPLFHGITIDDLAVRFSDLQLGEELGSGNFGTVRAGTLHGDKEVAVKSLNAGSSMNVKQFRKEAETMHKLRHPCLVSLLAICEDHGKMYIVTEKMSRGALRTLLRKDVHHTIKLSDLMEMASQVADGMCYLEMKGFVHRDLRAANVLAGDGNIVKIADFGMARLLDYYYGEEDYYRGKKGSVFPYKWTAPEAIKKQWFTVKSDVWSFGILLYEIVTYGDEPYAAMSNFEALRWVEMGNRLEKPVDYNCPLALYNVMRQCWLKNSDERPDFAYIKENLIEIKMNA